MANLIIIRGLPGSGKSTNAKNHMSQGGKIIHLEADMFFTKENGKYEFDGQFIHAAHRWCLDTAKVFLRQEYTVVVSNTFTVYSEMKGYVIFAINNGIDVSVITMSNKYGSIHDVPDHAMTRMANRFMSHDEIMDYISKESIVLSKNNS